MSKPELPRAAWPVDCALCILAFAIALFILPSNPAFAESGESGESYDVCSSGCPYRTIQSAIDAASSGATIRVAPGTYSESIVMRPRVSVTGAGQNQTTIRGNGSQVVVTFNNGQIARTTIIENLAIAGGGGDRGGGLLVSSGANPTVRNVTIRDNNTSQWGAGITVQNGADLLLEGALVKNNAAPTGSGLTVTGSQATVRNTTIENNVSNGAAQSGAVSVQAGATATLTNVTIRGTTATYGGGLRVLDNSTVTMSGGRIENNRASGSGGGASLTGNATLNLENVTLTGNSAPVAGAIFVSESALVVDDCRFVNNNASDSSGGAIYLVGVGGEIRNSSFENNRSNLAGGAIHFNQAANVLLFNSTLTGNSTTDGGAVYVTGGRVRIFENRVNANTAREYGGGIVITASATADIRGNEINHNTAGLDGGGLIFQRASSGTLAGNTISFNDTAHGGGGMTIYDRVSPTLSSNRFEGNTAEVGGAIVIDTNASPLIDGNEFVGNVVDFHGGAVSVNLNSNPVIKNSLFSNNRAQLEGGAIYVQDNSKATLEQNTITGNRAGTVGGGIVLHQDRNSRVTDNYIATNRAGQHGGGIYLNETGATLDGNQVLNNTAQQIGGGLVVLNGSPAIANNMISNNSAGSTGAGIYMAGSGATLTSNTIADNGRNAGGDGVFLNSGSNPRLKYNVLVGNDYGVRSGSGQPAEMMRNNVWGNRVANYTGVQRGSTDINVDPRWINGPQGKYYLSHSAAGQQTTSPLVDACFDSSATMGVDHLTTRTDGQPDRNNADMGYHYPRPLGRTVFMPAIRAG
ncbi:MAG: DUF1565 domain-containing protein [Anaerolineae bacterium]|nr:DUF1565 domain-containing protein [Anaerolineae bacterium]MCB0252597.1 DUF1565 domain-containing protein [Anaerolineae bacterium]